MTSAAELAFLPMEAGDLDAVLSLEQISHAHPWTRGNFSAVSYTHLTLPTILRV